jgi:hypothetical protein
MENVDFASSPIHGHGVFATEDIKPGIEIIRERALWVIDKITLVRGSFLTSLHDFTEMQDIMVNSFKRSNAFEEGSAEREQHEGMILGLCGGFVGDEEMPADPAQYQKLLSERLRQIIILNGIHEMLVEHEQPEKIAVFGFGARINHSCAPNVERVMVTATDGNCVRYSSLTAMPIVLETN